MQFKIEQQMITIMNMFNIIVQTQLKYLNIILHVDKCVLFTFALPLIYDGHDLNSNASLNLEASLSLSFLQWMYLE